MKQDFSNWIRRFILLIDRISQEALLINLRCGHILKYIPLLQIRVKT